MVWWTFFKVHTVIINNILINIEFPTFNKPACLLKQMQLLF